MVARSSPDLIVAGAGMAGLSAAARTRDLGALPRVHEKLDRPGGSMLLSSGVVWRYREFDRFRAECPHGDEELQRRGFEGLPPRPSFLATRGVGGCGAPPR